MNNVEYFQNEPESQLIDRKRATIHPTHIAEQLSAFANAEGGTLIIGYRR